MKVYIILMGCKTHGIYRFAPKLSLESMRSQPKTGVLIY